MQLTRGAVALVIVLALCSITQAQSLSPMHMRGPTPSDTKAFRLLVSNPYPGAMTFEVLVMEPGFEVGADHAAVQPAEVRLGAGRGRSVTVMFKIDPDKEERTIGVCVQPKEIPGTVLPRVCGTYTGVKYPAR